MVTHLVRIQLVDDDDADHEVYLLLHKEMKSRGFRRVIKTKKQRYKLPFGMYVCQDKASRKEILRRTMDSVARVKRRARIIVARVDGVAIDNLTEA